MAHTFNGDLKRIYIDPALPNVVVKELYSEWKEWVIQGNNLQYAQAFRTFGGDPTVAGQTAPAYYFLTNGWRIVVDGFYATFGYNLYTNEGESPIITLNNGTVLLNNSDVGIVTTSSAVGGGDTDLTPILTAIANLNDVTPEEVRAAFNESEFKDKNTEAEIHAWLDSYANKDNWKSTEVSATDVADAVWNKSLP